MDAYRQTLRDLADPISRMEAREEELKKKKKKPDKVDYDLLPPAQVPKLFNPTANKAQQIIMNPDTLPPKPKHAREFHKPSVRKQRASIQPSPSSYSPTLTTPDGVAPITDAEPALFTAPRKPKHIPRDPQTHMDVHGGAKQPATTNNLGISFHYLHFNVTLIFSNTLLISFIAFAPPLPTASTPNVSTEDSEMTETPIEVPTEVPAEAGGMYRPFLIPISSQASLKCFSLLLNWISAYH
jgi:hypothetical protein